MTHRYRRRLPDAPPAAAAATCRLQGVAFQEVLRAVAEAIRGGASDKAARQQLNALLSRLLFYEELPPELPLLLAPLLQVRVLGGRGREVAGGRRSSRRAMEQSYAACLPEEELSVGRPPDASAAAADVGQGPAAAAVRVPHPGGLRRRGLRGDAHPLRPLAR